MPKVVNSPPKSDKSTSVLPKTLPTPTQTVDKPLWDGPEANGENGGVTFSMLSKFLTCPERFRVRYVLGLTPVQKFNHRIEYGQMWHACEEALAARRPWDVALKVYVKDLMAKYQMDRDEIRKWYNVCLFQFPLYVEYWAKHPDVKERTPVFQEEVFDVPYRLPSGRTVRLRGKFDAVDLIRSAGIGKGESAGVYLQENKSKGDPNELELRRQLTYDLQTMLYLVALSEIDRRDGPLIKQSDGVPVRGVRYNVVRRPLSGGKGTIQRHKGKVLKNGTTKPDEPEDAFYKRAAQYVKDAPETYFMRWRVEVSETDVTRFRRECLDPLLERLCDWYNMVTTKGDPFSPSNNKDYRLHYRHPFGVVNSVDEYGYGDLDEFLASGSKVGLTRASLFTELKGQ